MASKSKITRQLLIIALALSALLNFGFIFSSWRQNVVVSVPDGDSLQLSDGRRIRLLGIEAPKRDMCMADKTHTTLMSHALGKHVRLKNTVTDSSGRLLANVIIEEPIDWLQYMSWWSKRWYYRITKQSIPDLIADPFLNRLLVKKGLARFTFVQSPYYDYLKRFQTDAKEKELGIWSETCRTMITNDPDAFLAPPDNP